MTEQFGVEPFVLPRKAAQLLISFAPPSDLAQVLGGTTTVPTFALDAPVVVENLWAQAGAGLLAALATERSLTNIETCSSYDSNELSASFDCSDRSAIERAWKSALRSNGIIGESDFHEMADGDGLRASLLKTRSRVTEEVARRAAEEGHLGRLRHRFAVQNELSRWYCLGPGAVSLLPRRSQDQFAPGRRSIATVFDTEQGDRLASEPDFQQQLLSRLDGLRLNATLTTGLVVLEVLAKDRDAWALGRLTLENGNTVEAGRPRGWLRIDRRALADWYRATSRSHREPERTDLWRALLVLTCVQECGFPTSPWPASTRRLLEAVVDGYQLVDQSGPAGELVARLNECGVVRDDAFYVLIAGDWAGSYLPHHLDRQGVLHWGQRVRTAIRGDSSLGTYEKAALRAAAQGSTYVYFEPRLWQNALRIGLNARQQRLLLSLLVERPGGRKGAQEPSSSLNGFKDTGYQVAVRMAAAAYGSAQSRLGEFVSDLEVLSQRLGLVVHTRRGTVINEDGLAVLRKARGRKKLPGKTLLVMCYLLSSEDQQVNNCPPSRRLPKSYAAVFCELRISAGLTQKEVAVILGVRRTAITNWENGTRAIPTDTFREFKDYCAQMSQRRGRATVARHDSPR